MPIGAGWPALRRVAIAIAALGLAGFALWWVTIRPRAAQVEAAKAKVEAATATATAGAAQAATRITVDVLEHRAAIDATTRENDVAIHAAAGADDSIGADLDRAGRFALCMRAAYRGDARCAAVRGDGRRVGASLPDAGSFTPAG